MEKKMNSPKRKLEQFARKYNVAYVASYGLTIDNLYDAKNIVSEFSDMSSSGVDAGIATDIIESPETGLLLALVYGHPDTISYRDLCKVAKNVSKTLPGDKF